MDLKAQAEVLLGSKLAQVRLVTDTTQFMELGRGIPTLRQLKQQTPEVLDRMDTGDLSLVSPNRAFNLKKVYPYLPEELNRMLMHFAASAPVFYERVGEIIDDLRGGLAQLPGPV